MKKGPFDDFRKAELTLEELADASERISLELGFRPEDRRVGSINERTIRFYQHKKLLEPPRKRGRQVVYRFLHLLQVVTLRRLQAEGYSLDGVKELLESGELPWKSARSLERAIVLAARAAESTPTAMSFARRATRKPDARARSDIPPLSSTSSTPSMSQSFMADQPAPAAPDEEWHRLREELLHHVDRRMREIAEQHLTHGLDHLAPRLEAMLTELLQRKLEEERTSREIQPGVRILIDPSRVSDPDEVLSRIEQALSDDT